MSRLQDAPVVNLLRCGWAGSQKYGNVIPQHGGIDRELEPADQQLPEIRVVGIVGHEAADVGGPPGHAGHRHAQSRPYLTLEALKGGINIAGPDQRPVENEVWSYGEDCLQVMKKYLFLRERLRPYIRKQMELTHEKGIPVMRPPIGRRTQTAAPECPPERLCANSPDSAGSSPGAAAGCGAPALVPGDAGAVLRTGGADAPAFREL